MKRIADEAEVIVRLDYAEKKAHITVSAWPAMARKMERLYGESKDGRNTSSAARWTVDLKAISFRRLDMSPRTPHQIPHFATATRTSGQSSHLAPETGHELSTHGAEVMGSSDERSEFAAELPRSFRQKCETSSTRMNSPAT